MSTRRRASLDHDHERRRTRWKVQWGVPARAAGGTARAAALSSDERREIARKAAKARWARHLPQATHQGLLRFGDIEIEVAVLDDGQRVITHGGFMVGLGRIRPPKGRQYYRNGANLPAFLTVANLKPFVGEDLVVVAGQIEFRSKQGIRAFGYAPNFLRKVCEVFARAQDAGLLRATQRTIANRAGVVAKQFERSDMMRLIDEAAGYHETREM
ncbi:hypothetical protein A1D31_27315 [Bradyrhizobium liaoningense]|nr:hypothetical protein A1D31_27315 [Bradyrhizobium liaoningense]